jgi:transaldolase
MANGMTNPLLKIGTFGQSVWLDSLSRGMLTSGQLRRMIEDDGLRGVTSNPAIFEKAITGSRDYDVALRTLALQGKSAEEMYDTIVVDDVGVAANLFRPLFDRLDGRDGFVSLEVSPRVAHDTQATLAEARRLWREVNRPNVLIKIPGTDEGLPAIQQAIAEGININVTLLFGLSRYREVAEAFLSGMEARSSLGLPLRPVASVASFFLSRMDTMVDAMLDDIDRAGGPKEVTETIRGRTAIACAKMAYQVYEDVFSKPRFDDLADRGARPQRLLWASTSTKNPRYRDVMYVEELIGPETVNTIPLETLDAYRDHGNPAPRLKDNLAEAREVLDRVIELGIDLEDVARRLEAEGIQKFVKPFDHLMSAIETIREAARETAASGMGT